MRQTTMFKRILIGVTLGVSCSAFALGINATAGRGPFGRHLHEVKKKQLFNLPGNCTEAFLNCNPAQMTGNDWLLLQHLFYVNMPVPVSAVVFEAVFADS